MKKLLALMLAAALALSLVACGGDSGAGDNNTPSGGEDSAPGETTMTKEEMLEVAETVSGDDMEADYQANQARARLTYCDKPLLIESLFVWQVTSDHAEVLASSDSGSTSIDVYLPLEDLVEIEKGDYISFVGIISDIQEIEDETSGWGLFNSTFAHYIMDTAYLVTVEHRNT